MRDDVVRSLRCPVCRAPLAEVPGSLRCGAGHAFDLARHGYAALLGGRRSGLEGDDAAMVAARARFLAAGHFEPLAAALAALARGVAPGLVVEVGAGTAFYLARVLEALPERSGLAVDLSKYASRRAARAHPRADAIVADARAPLPLADGCAALVLDVFAPRNGPELRRVLRADGALLVATPAPSHLAELREPLGLLEVDPEKERRVRDALGPWFDRASSQPLAWTMQLPRDDAGALAAMGPSARHVAPEALAARVAALPSLASVSAAVVLERWIPRR